MAVETCRPLPRRRSGHTTSVRIGSEQFHLTANRRGDGTLGEVFIHWGKPGTSAAGLLSSYAIAMSLGLRHRVPLTDLIRPGLDQCFAPSGHTDDPEIPRVRSVIDYVARRLAIDWLPYPERAALGVLTVRETHELAAGAEGKQLAGGDPRRYRVDPIQPFRELLALQRYVMVKHGLAQLSRVRAMQVRQLGPAMHGHGQLLARHVRGADRRPGGQVPHPHRVPGGTEPERPVQEEAVYRASQWAPVGGHGGHHEQPQPRQPAGQLGGGQAAPGCDDVAQMRARTGVAAIQELLQAGEFGWCLEHGAD